MPTTNPVALLQALVKLPSVNPMGRAVQGPQYFEHQVSAYLEQFFTDLGVPCERQHVAPLRDNIVARWNAPGARQTVLWEAHQDTVPTDNMTIDPFGAVIKDGRMYGRGACDIKSGLAAMLAAFARLVREKPAGAMNVILACTVDEEATFLGVQELVKRGVKADLAVIAEPTQLHIVHAHKGVARMVLTTPGTACHSSTPEKGVNAIYRMGPVLAALDQFAQKLRASRSDPVLGPPTMSVGRIEGGTSVNTVPDSCRIEIDRRVIPGEDAAACSEQITRFLRDEAKLPVPFECAPPWMSMPALFTDKNADVVQRLGAAIDAVCGRHDVIPVPYGTDAAIIALAGIPSVVFGAGDIAQAHTKDEWIALEQVEKASEILYNMVSRG